MSFLNTPNTSIKLDEPNEIMMKTLCYPIAKSFLEQYPQHYDTIRTFEDAMENIQEMIEKTGVIDSMIKITDKEFIHFKLNVVNSKIFSPDSLESAQYSNFGYYPTPNRAIFKRQSYTCCLIGDVNFSFQVINKTSLLDNEENNSKEVTGSIPNGYCVNIPIPIGCRWCSLNNYDKLTLIKSGEECEAYKGSFIIEGNARHILTMYRKPFNRNVIVQNRFDNQLSRSEGIYTNKFLYENSYYIVGSMVDKKGTHVGRGGREINVPDFGLSLQLNHPAMNIDMSYDRKKSKAIPNFVPIKYIFAAFNCIRDEDMMKYICPELNDSGLIHAVSNACLLGHSHKEACQMANIKLKAGQYIIYQEPLTQFTAKYIIGQIILNPTTKDTLLKEAKNNENNYKLLVAQVVDSIFDERFMPGINMERNERNIAICTEVGMMIKHLYLIGRNLEESQDRRSLVNRRIRNCQQLLYEYKAFHGARYRDAMVNITRLFNENKGKYSITEGFLSKMIVIMKNVGMEMSRSLINSFKMTSKERSKMRTDVIAPKNQPYIWNKFREIVISPDTRKEGSSVSWDHRAIHNSELFFICPTQTPEAGAQTGRFKTPTIYSYITTQTVPEEVFKILKEDENVSRVVILKDPYYIIRVNGSISGYIREYKPVEELYKTLMKLRSSSKIEKDTSIILNHNNSTLDIWTDSGRIVSPFVIAHNCLDLTLDKDNSKSFELVGNVSIKSTFQEWLKNCNEKLFQFDKGIELGFIEFLCPEMAINNCVIAPSMREFLEKPFTYTHIALPNHIHGLIASLIPGINLDMPVKSSLATNYVKQSVGGSLRMPQLKYINEMNVLTNPEVPIARTCTYNHLHMNETPYGQNVIVCFMHAAYNQEDAVIINQASIDNGILKMDSIHDVVYKIDKNDEEFTIPTGVTLNGNPASYAKLGQRSGLPRKIGDRFNTNDVIIGKITKTEHGNIDTSILNGRPDGRYPISANSREIRCIVKNKIHDENKILKMTVFGQWRHMLTGDKENSDHGQKGTCGKIIKPEHMPYTSNGLRPDIIFDPDAILHRNTFGQVDIPVITTIACLLGCQIDHTSYHTIRTVEDIHKILEQLGLNKHLKQKLYDGDTGQAFQCDIFIGVHYWQRQLHLVENKLNIRWDGPRIFTTNQPLKGKRRGGGQSIDRMSFDSHVASGICEIQRDMHLNQGSSIKIGLCNRCNSCMCYFNKKYKRWQCQRCGMHHEITIRDIPPATNLMNHALVGLHIGLEYFPSYDMKNNLREVVTGLDIGEEEEDVEEDSEEGIVDEEES
jgi:DNA-directed RNA polymerase beta subunit